MPSACQMQKIQTLMPFHFLLEIYIQVFPPCVLNLSNMVAALCQAAALWQLQEHMVWLAGCQGHGTLTGALPVPAQPPLGPLLSPAMGQNPTGVPAPVLPQGAELSSAQPWLCQAQFHPQGPAQPFCDCGWSWFPAPSLNLTPTPGGTSWPGLVLSPFPGSCWSCSQTSLVLGWGPPGNTHCLCQSQCPGTVVSNFQTWPWKDLFDHFSWERLIQKGLGLKCTQRASVAPALWFFTRSTDSPLKRQCVSGNSLCHGGIQRFLT